MNERRQNLKSVVRLLEEQLVLDLLNVLLLQRVCAAVVDATTVASPFLSSLSYISTKRNCLQTTAQLREKCISYQPSLWREFVQSCQSIHFTKHLNAREAGNNKYYQSRLL